MNNEQNINQPIQPETPVQEPVQQVNMNYNQAPQNSYGTKKNNHIKEIIIIAVAVVLIAVAGYFIYNKFFSNKDDYYMEILDQNKLIPIEENELYGYIDTKGKVVIKPQYESAGSFFDGYAVVSAEAPETEDSILSADTIDYIINEKGEIKLASKPYYLLSGTTYIPEYKVWVVDGRLYDKKLKAITPETTLVDYEDGIFTYEDTLDNTVGLMNEKGEKIYTYKGKDSLPYIYVDPSDIDDTLQEQYCKINIDDDSVEKYGIINCKTGVEVVELKNKYIMTDDDNIFTIYTTEDYGSSDEKDKFMYIQNDKIMYEVKASGYDVTLEYNDGGYLEIYDRTKDYSDRYSYYNLSTGKTTTDEPDVEDTDSLSEWEELTGYTEFSCDNGYGLMSEDKVALSCEWDSIEYLNVDVYKYLQAKAKKSIVVVEKDNSTTLYDMKKNASVFRFNASYISDYATSTFVKAEDDETNETIVYNLATNKYQTFKEDEDVSVYSNYITVEKDDTVKYYNTNLEHIYTVNNK